MISQARKYILQQSFADSLICKGLLQNIFSFQISNFSIITQKTETMLHYYLMLFHKEEFHCIDTFLSNAMRIKSFFVFVVTVLLTFSPPFSVQGVFFPRTSLSWPPCVPNPASSPSCCPSTMSREFSSWALKWAAHPSSCTRIRPANQHRRTTPCSVTSTSLTESMSNLKRWAHTITCLSRHKVHAAYSWWKHHFWDWKMIIIDE